MRIYTPKVENFIQGGVDTVERYLKDNSFPAIVSAYKCDETSATLIDLANGATIEIESGATHTLTGQYLDSVHNGKVWLAMIKADTLAFYREELARLSASIAGESGNALQSMQEQIDRYTRKIALAA